MIYLVYACDRNATLCLVGSSGGSGSREASKSRGTPGKGKEVAAGQVYSPAVQRPRLPPTFYRPADPVPVRLLHQLHFENMGLEFPCAWDCTMPNCSNRLRTDLVRVGPSNLIRGQSGLFARDVIIEGTVVAYFGCMRELRKGEVGDSTRLGYSFVVQETGGRKIEITPRQGITEECLAHAINHTCHTDFENCKFLHTVITKDPRGEGKKEEGGVGGGRASVVFVQATRRVERGEEFFANYGTDFRFPHGCQCHLCWGHVAT